MSAALGLVVPVFNEERRLAEFVPQLLDHVRSLPAGSELVFVDDGSTDATAEIAEQLVAGEPRARVLRRPHEGKGAAVAAGLRSCTLPYAAFCDVDLSTPLDQLDLVVEVARRAPVLAIASRDLSTSQLERPESRIREALGRTYNRLLQLTVTPGIVDTQCGAKAARREVWERVLAHTEERGFAWDAEAVAIALALGIPVHEVPVTWRHDERSGINVARDGAAMVRATARIARRARRARRAAGTDVRVAATHWWFRSKAALVATAIRRTGGGSGPLVDVGGGDGAVAASIGWDPATIVVLDLEHDALVDASQSRGLMGARADLRVLPVRSASAAAVLALDALEHVAEPEAVLREIARIARPGGTVVVTVPALQWLWSAHDDRLGHHCRYTTAAVDALVRGAELEPVMLTYVFSWLVVPMYVVRRVLHRSGLDMGGALTDRVALVLTAVERRLLGRVRVPIGSTVLCVARRPA
jgi:dolichyl-phosphate beta-glucosyltransferase